MLHQCFRAWEPRSSVPATAQITMSKPIHSLSSRVCPTVPRCRTVVSLLRILEPGPRAAPSVGRNATTVGRVTAHSLPDSRIVPRLTKKPAPSVGRNVSTKTPVTQQRLGESSVDFDDRLSNKTFSHHLQVRSLSCAQTASVRTVLFHHASDRTPV